MSKSKITDPLKLIRKQGDAWEDANCGELSEVAEKIYRDIVDKYVPVEVKMDATKRMLIIIENSSGCTGLVWLDE